MPGATGVSQSPPTTLHPLLVKQGLELAVQRQAPRFPTEVNDEAIPSSPHSQVSTIPNYATSPPVISRINRPALAPINYVGPNATDLDSNGTNEVGGEEGDFTPETYSMFRFAHTSTPGEHPYVYQGYLSHGRRSSFEDKTLIYDSGARKWRSIPAGYVAPPQPAGSFEDDLRDRLLRARRRDQALLDNLNSNDGEERYSDVPGEVASSPGLASRSTKSDEDTIRDGVSSPSGSSYAQTSKARKAQSQRRGQSPDDTAKEDLALEDEWEEDAADEDGLSSKPHSPLRCPQHRSNRSSRATHSSRRLHGQRIPNQLHLNGDHEGSVTSNNGTVENGDVGDGNDNEEDGQDGQDEGDGNDNEEGGEGGEEDDDDDDDGQSGRDEESLLGSDKPAGHRRGRYSLGEKSAIARLRKDIYKLAEAVAVKYKRSATRILSKALPEIKVARKDNPYSLFKAHKARFGKYKADRGMCSYLWSFLFY
jgi:hypothetical protein